MFDVNRGDPKQPKIIDERVFNGAACGSNGFSIISLWKSPYGNFSYKSALLKCSNNNN